MNGGQADVVVIGAGLSGLSAARGLVAKGLRVTVLEARDRVGGRTFTQPLGDGVIDSGGQWIGPHQTRVQALVQELSGTLEPTWHEGSKVLDLDGRVSTYSGTIPKVAIWKLLRLQWAISRIDRMALQVPCGRPWAAALASEWDAMTLQEWLKKTARSPHAIALFNSAARVIFGADAGELSFLHVLHYVHQSGGLMNLIEAEGGNQQWRVTGGTQQLSEWLARDLDLVLESPVHAIEQDERGVLVHSAKGSWTAARVVVAMPPHLMHRIDCRPPLPTLRSQLHQRSAMGATIKCFALYDRAFWRERGLSGESVTTSGPVSMSMDNFNSAGQPGLVVFLTGAPARGWSERAETTRRALVLGALGQYFGEEASHPTCYHEMDWSTERFSGGAPVSNLSPGTWTTFGPALYAPVGRIHWAGTETARESTGFMEGALESGQRVAAEILEALS